jgi:hypothetical protein
MKSKIKLKKMMLISFLLINMYEVYSKPVIYIRTRSGGGLFGFEHVESYTEIGTEYDIVTTNCWSAGFKRCRHTFRSVEEEIKLKISEDALNKVIEAIDLQIESGIHTGKLKVEDQCIIYWSLSNDTQGSDYVINETEKSDTLKLMIYFNKEAENLQID